MTPRPFVLAERFKAVQGEGVFSGTPMAFLRTVGCSVGQGVCTHCDTDFSKSHPALGGGTFTVEELVQWVRPYRHACLTGGEPLDRDLRPLIFALSAAGVLCHIETSGTRHPAWLDRPGAHEPGMHMVARDHGDGTVGWYDTPLWVTVSPKPAWLPGMLALADEIKFINGGLGDGPDWPTLADALRWAAERLPRDRPVYLQPRNGRTEVDRDNLREAIQVVAENPTLRLSCQLHKFLGER